MQHVIDLLDWTGEDLKALLKDAARLKAELRKGKRRPLLKGHALGMIFEKPSLRTRVSFETAMAQLGGNSVFLSGPDIGLGTRESIADFARTLSQYVDGIVLRTFQHRTIEAFAQYADCPIINGLSDLHHPCQALGDLLTIQEEFGDLEGRTIAFIGDGNNVARSLAICCGKLGMQFILATPDGYGFDKLFLSECQRLVPRGTILVNGEPAHAVEHADIIYTDVWASMGQEAERKVRLKRFAAYQVNEKLLALAPKHARFMHCLPAHRGEEVTDAVLDGPRSIAFQQAGNRMHAQKALLVRLLGNPRMTAARRVRKTVKH
jgi:ornithine carbamoyltransferase